MDSPTVTVILPTFNRAHFLAKAIRSVLQQTYKKFEIVVIDDGSTDDTAQIVADFDDTRIHYIYQENRGRAVVRNHGLAVARGKYIAFLDDDDLFLPEKLALQVDQLDHSPKIDLVASGALFVNENGETLDAWFPWQTQPELTLEKCLFACPVLTCAVLFRREALDRLDSWFDAELPRAQDTDFFLRMLAAGLRFDWSNDILCVYRQHTQNKQVDGLLYRQSYQRLVDKLLSLPLLQSASFVNSAVLRAHYRVLSAFHEIHSEYGAEAQEDLATAVDLDPTLLVGNPPKLVAMLSGFANSARIQSPTLFLAQAFDNLPDNCQSLRKYRRSALSSIYMTRVFSDHSKRQNLRVSDWVRGVVYNPAWLANRGVWSLLIKRILTPRGIR